MRSGLKSSLARDVGVTLSEPGVADLSMALLVEMVLVHEETVPWSMEVSVGGRKLRWVGPGFVALISS